MLGMGKRVMLFLAVNFLILVTIQVAWSLIGPYIGIGNPQTNYLIFFSVVFGFGGAFISLFLSKWMAKRMMGLEVLDPGTAQGVGRELVETVHRLARAAGLPKMPEVAYYESPEVNAFATGPSRSNSLVAVSSGLLDRMGKADVEGVLAHEVAHIANGDMVTMTLIQGVVNATVLFFAHTLASLVSSFVDERVRPWIRFPLVIVFEILFSLLGTIVVNIYSRRREYRADAGGAKLAGRDKMIGALRALEGADELVDSGQPAMASLKISSGRKSALMMMFSTHPPLSDRIRRLERGVS